MGRGRPKAVVNEVSATNRLNREVPATFMAGWPGWRSQIAIIAGPAATTEPAVSLGHTAAMHVISATMAGRG